MAQDGDQRQTLVNKVMNPFGFHEKRGMFQVATQLQASRVVSSAQLSLL
jgi:hypothetical protein